MVVHEVVAGQRPGPEPHIRQRRAQRVPADPCRGGGAGAAAAADARLALVAQVGHRGDHAGQDLGLETEHTILVAGHGSDTGQDTVHSLQNAASRATRTKACPCIVCSIWPDRQGCALCCWAALQYRIVMTHPLQTSSVPSLTNALLHATSSSRARRQQRDGSRVNGQ